MSTVTLEPIVESPAQPELDEETRRVFRDARRLLIEKGWIQGHSSSPLGFCIMGALWHEGIESNSPAYKSIHQLLGAGSSVSAWNDDPSRTKAEVIDLFDRLLA